MAGFPGPFAYPFGGEPQPPSSLFTRILRHLLPRARAWRLPFGGPLHRLVEGLSAEPSVVRGYLDAVYEDLAPDTTRELALWERQFGIKAGATTALRIAALDAEWKATGGQSPRYLQDIVQAADFDAYIHEWWSSGPPYVARDPRSYTQQPLLGSVQCGEDLAECGEPSAQANIFLANDPGYIVNEALTDAAPPAIPSDPTTWPHFLYWGGRDFPTRALIESSRRADFEELILRLCPSEKWLVTRATYTEQAPPPSLPWHTLILPSTGVTLASGAVSQIRNLGSSGIHFGEGTPGARPTVVTGAHGKPVLRFDGLDDRLATESDITLPTNYLVWTVARVVTPPTALGHFGHLWVQQDGGVWERLTFGADDRISYVLASQDNLNLTPPVPITDTVEYVVRAYAYPVGELRLNNVVLDASSPGSSSAPITGKMTIGNQPGGGSTQSLAVDISAFGILDADAVSEADLAALHAYSKAEFGVA